ncbi:MAG: hypothetical protein M1304_00575 [Candidatus Thermoplasmatota archaeon]|jgi:hypothetical protein|nr:hypothetical protein [Candidatus Thermoplasmatota archaeon]
MSAEKTFYTIIAVIVVVAGIGIGAAYYDSVSSVHAVSTPPSSSLTLVITPSNWYNNSIHGTAPNGFGGHHGQPAYFVLEPNGTLGSSASITLPSHQLISLTIIDYDSGPAPGLGNATANSSATGTAQLDQNLLIQNNSYFANVTGTVGGVEYIYNGTALAENATVTSNVTNGISINHGAGWAVKSLPWIGNATSGGYMVTHTFTILNGPSVVVNIPSWAGFNGGTVTHASFYINQTGTLSWQCYAPCGTGPSGWDGAMATAGWMMGTITVS